MEATVFLAIYKEGRRRLHLSSYSVILKLPAASGKTPAVYAGAAGLLSVYSLAHHAAMGKCVLNNPHIHPVAGYVVSGLGTEPHSLHLKGKDTADHRGYNQRDKNNKKVKPLGR